MKATEFFGEGLLLVIKHYGGNIVDYAVVLDGRKYYHLWVFDSCEQTYKRRAILKDFKEIFSLLENDVLNNPKIEG